MASAKDKLRILENVIGRVGMGGDILSEYSKALSLYGQMEIENDLTPPMGMPSEPETPPPIGQNMI